MEEIQNWDDVPTFKSIEEEHTFWKNHVLALRLLEESCVNAAVESTTMTLRIDPRMLAKLKRLAAQRYLNYQSMLKQWVAERLEKEISDRGN